MTEPSEPLAGKASARPARLWRTLLRRPVAVVALAYLGLLIVAAAAAPLLAPYDPTATDLDHVLSGPTLSHPFGTDNLGRDVLSRLMYGGRVSLTGVAEAVLTTLVLGVTAGLLAGFAGGWVDRVISWIVDMVLAVPVIITLLVVLSVVGSNETAAMITVGVLTAPGLARVVRGTTMAVRKELYVSAARVAGLPGRRIVIGQVLPRAAGPIIVQVSLGAGGALLAQAGIEFLGLGVQPPTPTWGGMVNDASQVIDKQPFLLLPTGLVVGLAILAFGLLGDAVRDAAADRGSRSSTRIRRRRAGPVQPVSPEAPGALLELRDVRVELTGLDGNRDAVPVVDGVSLHISPGETVGLVGESGCGKSITGRAVLGLLPPGAECTAGGIFFDGARLTARSRRAARGKRIALVSQEPVGSLDPVFTVGHQVDELVRRHHGGRRAAVRARTLDLLASVRLPDPAAVVKRYPHELSGGMAQRVAIAMALAGDPRLLIADEPTTALDVTVQAEILDLLRGLQQQRGMAILLISHDWGVVADLCARAYVMYAGHIVESAPVLPLVDGPRHPYTAGLLRCGPRSVAPRTMLRAIEGGVPGPGEWPAGCHFRARCPLADNDCAQGPIAMAEPESGHRTRCLHHTDLAKESDDEPIGTPA
ncbi:MAG TPA: dipeptide/oligopeptide/nickel ABC transporter permease/ATP-binding protein [Pseudonocardiaceae bacterium]|nr:dipeptide/oligopeptide/nickel ABC transporter permease/ATP-binding protein [Pseudonocardiaceae bacterium]